MFPTFLFVERYQDAHGCVVIADSGLQSLVFAFLLSFGTGDLYQYRFSVHIVRCVAEYATAVYAISGVGVPVPCVVKCLSCGSMSRSPLPLKMVLYLRLELKGGSKQIRST